MVFFFCRSFLQRKSICSASTGTLPRWRMKGVPKKTSTITPSSTAPVISVSPEMGLLIDRLCKDKFLEEDSFWKADCARFDPRKLNMYEHSMGFLKSAVDRFGCKNQEIAKWLSGKHLKEVVMTGCPSTDRKTVYAAKRLRSFFGIHEDNVCSGCSLRSSCKFPNKTTGGQPKVILVDVLFVLIGYSLLLPPVSTSSPNHMFSVNKILREAIRLSTK